MKIVFLTNVISPHQVPLAREIVARVGEGNYHYVHTDPLEPERVKMGWGGDDEPWCLQGDATHPVFKEADVVFSGHRELELFEESLATGKIVIYTAERWFKPPLGILRLLVPSYFRMARRLIKLFRNPNFYYFPSGIHAARDMLRLVGLFRGDLRCLFRAPAALFEPVPCGRIVPNTRSRRRALPAQLRSFLRKFGFARLPEVLPSDLPPERGIWAHLRIWGYFVAPGRGGGGRSLPIQHPPGVLWVGRMLDWKRAGDLVRACRPHPDLKRAGILLDLYGHGPMEPMLRKLAEGAENIRFHDFVPVAQVRDLMRAHDVYVLPSNAYEGWGAVVSEALEEGMQVFASAESGAGATLLPPSNLFRAGDVARLAKLLQAESLPRPSIGAWSASGAANALLAFLNKRTNA